MSRFLAFAAAAILSSTASAADLPIMDDPVEQAAAVAYDWSGVYIGIQGGWQWHHDEFEDPIPPFFGDLDFDGAIAGGHIGADRQFGHIVVGLVGDFEWADGDGQSVADNNAAVFGRAEANWQGSIRGRVGAAFDRVLVYGTGGLAFANYDFDYTFPVPVFGIGDQFDETVLGYTVGGGVAIAAFSSWEIWGDYRFSEYETASSGIVVCCAGPPNRQDHEVTTHAVRVGVSRRFGGGMP
jgi:outer membrane immunogenic protein